MTTKLTLRLDDAVIRKAKKTASKNGVSLSRMVEDYFKAVADQGTQEVREPPVLYEVSGVFRASRMPRSCERDIGSISRRNTVERQSTYHSPRPSRTLRTRCSIIQRSMSKPTA